MIDWIRDTETGELYPVESDFNFETPAHLEIPEYTTIDYDKTKQMTITELQNQLIAAQNHIEAIESEKTSDDNSAVTVNEVFPEIVSRPEKTSSPNISFAIVFSVISVLVILVFAFGLSVFISENDIEISIPNTSKQQTVDYEVTPIPENDIVPKTEQSETQEQQNTEQEQIETRQDNNLINEFFNYVQPALVILVSLVGVKLGMSILRNSCH